MDSSAEKVFKEVPYEQKVRTKKMLMFLIIFAIVMMFAGLTSAYLVLNPMIYWVHITPPSFLMYSNIIIVISSITLYLAYKKLRAGKQQLASNLIIATFILGLAFSFTQFQGWQQLASKGMGFKVSMMENGQEKYNWNFVGDIDAEYGKDYVIYKEGNVLVLENGEFYLPNDKERSKPVTDEATGYSNTSSSFIFVLIWAHIIHLALGLGYLISLILRARRNALNKDNWISLYTGGMYWHFLGILWLYLFVFLFYIH